MEKPVSFAKAEECKDVRCAKVVARRGIPILLYGLDFERKLIECKHVLTPTGDVDADMKIIKTYFKDFKGKKPELFSVGEL